jgi:hypothetical protein
MSSGSWMSDLVKGSFVSQWILLLRFADARLVGKVPAMNMQVHAERDTARFMRHRHEISADDWTAVEAFRQEHGAEIEQLLDDSLTGRFSTNSPLPEFDASEIAGQYRLLLPFAAQYTVHADLEAEGYLRQLHNLGEEEWVQTWDFLIGQEELWRGE